MVHNRNIKEQTYKILNEKDLKLIELTKYQIAFPKTIEKASFEYENLEKKED